MFCLGLLILVLMSGCNCEQFYNKDEYSINLKLINSKKSRYLSRLVVLA